MKHAAILVVAALLFGTIGAVAADKPTVLVVGANGRTGQPLVKILKARGYRVRASVRNQEAASGLGADETVVADVTKPETLPGAVKSVTYVVTVIGAGNDDPEKIEYAGNAALMDAAKAGGAKQFVMMSAIGAEITSPEDPNVRRPLVSIAKGKAEAHLRKTGMAYTIIRPGGLSVCDEGKSGIALGKLTAAQLSTTPHPPICRADVALVIAESLGNAAALNKTFTVIGAPNEAPDKWKAALAGLPRD